MDLNIEHLIINEIKLRKIKLKKIKLMENKFKEIKMKILLSIIIYWVEPEIIFQAFKLCFYVFTIYFEIMLLFLVYFVCLIWTL